MIAGNIIPGGGHARRGGGGGARRELGGTRAEKGPLSGGRDPKSQVSRLVEVSPQWEKT